MNRIYSIPSIVSTRWTYCVKLQASVAALVPVCSGEKCNHVGFDGCSNLPNGDVAGAFYFPADITTTPSCILKVGSFTSLPCDISSPHSCELGTSTGYGFQCLFSQAINCADTTILICDGVESVPCDHGV